MNKIHKKNFSQTTTKKRITLRNCLTKISVSSWLRSGYTAKQVCIRRHKENWLSGFICDSFKTNMCSASHNYANNIY